MAYPSPDPTELRRFLAALRSVESGGRYDAVNSSSGARGAYQIMPANWPGWASRYLGDRDAPWTQENQDRVASGKVADLYRWLGEWRRVAAWWLAGGAAATGDPARWSDSLRSYVAAVLSRFDRYGPQDGPEPAEPVAAPVSAPPAGCAPVAAVLLALVAIAAAGAGAVSWP